VGGHSPETARAAAPGDPPATGDAATPSQDDALHRYAREIAAAPAGHRAIWLHLSRFEHSGSRDHHIEIACKVVEELIKHFVGRMFMLESGDIVLVCKDINEKIIQDSISLLRDLFQNVPQVRDGGLRFCTVFDLETESARFLAALPPLRVNAPKPAVLSAARAAPRPATARPQPVRAPRARPAGLNRHVKMAILLGALALVIGGEGLLAYRSSQQPWVFNGPEALKAHQVRNPLTGEYSNRR
jgi:hypothetical protein